MKYLVLVFSLIAFSACSDNDPKTEEQTQDDFYEGPITASMKGYELYSWQQDGAWKFTLITGTNRLKTYTEITNPDNEVTDTFFKVTVTGSSALKNLLSRLPAEQSIAWIASEVFVSGFSFPSANVVDDIKAHCSSLSIQLSVVE